MVRRLFQTVGNWSSVKRGHLLQNVSERVLKKRSDRKLVMGDREYTGVKETEGGR